MLSLKRRVTKIGNLDEEREMLQLGQSSQTKRPRIVAAIPCFNTEPFIAHVVSKARNHVDQVIVVDDGSHDGTAEAARAAGALVRSHGANRGYGEAIKSCFEAARSSAADVLVILDGDGQHNPDEIPQLLAPILQGEADLIIGSRFLTMENTMPRYRRFGIGVITFLWNFGSKIRVSDAQSGFRVYRREVFQSLSLAERGMSISMEILEKARRKRAIIKEVPVSCKYIVLTINLRAIRQGLGIALSTVKLRLRHLICRWGVSH